MSAHRQFGLIALVLLAVLGFVAFTNSGSDEPTQTQQTEEPLDTQGELQSAPSPSRNEQRGQLRSFTATDFKNAYDNLSLPNITPIVEAPFITGNSAVDGYIYAKAEARGYQLRHVASGLLNQIDGLPVQELLIQSWADLRQAAREDGITVNFRSGYRSIEAQRELFLERLRAAGITESAILSGSQDVALDQLLSLTAPPGYSRHHGGYTIDLEDPSAAVFAQSAAYQWLAADNFARAKQFGFIPSYPEGLSNQGPNPEPWEFVWVSKDVTYE